MGWQLIDGRLDNSTTSQTPGTYADFFYPALSVLRPDLLEIGQEPSFVLIVGMADIVAYLGFFPAYLTLLAHGKSLLKYMHWGCFTAPAL